MAERRNDYTDLLSREPAVPKSVSVVVPWFNAHRYLGLFRQGLTAQTNQDVELVLVDDGSAEPLSPDPGPWREVARDVLLVRHGDNHGGAAALNTGCLLASGETVIMLDSDLATPPNLVADFRRTLSASDELCAVGFRGTAAVRADGTLSPSTLTDDWRAEIRPVDHFEIVTAQPVSARPPRRVYRLLAETRDWRDFGAGRVIGYWDLPAMVVGHTVAVHRAVYLDVGGTPEWCVGWGIRDTALGASLIAAGMKIVPQTSVVSTQAAHPPLAGSRERQLAELRANYQRYQQWLDRPPDLAPIRPRRITGRHRGTLRVELGQ